MRLMSCRDAPRSDSGWLQATLSEGRRSWHYDTLSSPQLPPGSTAHQGTTGREELFGDGRRHCYRRSRRTLSELRDGAAGGLSQSTPR